MHESVLGKSLFTLFVSLLYLFLYLPIVILVIFSFNNGPFPAPWVGFTLKWYKELSHSPALWSAFYNSVIVAACATFCSLLMSIGLVYYQSCNRWIDGLIYIFYGTIFIPEIVFAIGLLSFFSLCSLSLGIPALVAGHTILGLGYAVPIIYASYESLDTNLQEASLDLGATKSQTFFKITLPLLQPAILVAGLLVFIISFDDFIVSFFCAGSEAQTLSLYIYSMIRQGISPVINALSTLLLVFSSLLVFIFCSLTLRPKIW